MARRECAPAAAEAARDAARLAAMTDAPSMRDRPTARVRAMMRTPQRAAGAATRARRRAASRVAPRPLYVLALYYGQAKHINAGVTLKMRAPTTSPLATSSRLRSRGLSADQPYRFKMMPRFLSSTMRPVAQCSFCLLPMTTSVVGSRRAQVGLACAPTSPEDADDIGHATRPRPRRRRRRHTTQQAGATAAAIYQGKRTTPDEEPHMTTCRTRTPRYAALRWRRC